MPKQVVKKTAEGAVLDVQWGAAGKAVEVHAVIPREGDEGEAHAYFALSRRDVNDLIRVLRRARDRMYGRDE